MWRPVLVLLCFCGCDATSSSPPTAPTQTASPAASDVPVVAKEAGTDSNLCGCALCKPVVSNDTCKTDDDCAPSVPCHATACVGKANAVLRKPGDMCTQDLHCDSIDANACGCVGGFCTLHPR